MRNLFNPKRGFTLIELVIVIGILAVLVAVVISVLNPARYLAKSRDTRRQSDLKMIQAALEAYYSQKNAYPASTDFTFGAKWTGYLTLVPEDPQKGTNPNYCYEVLSGSQGYLLCAKSELGIAGGTVGTGTTCNSTYDYCLKNPF